jgi:hypothetical protein
MYVKVTKSAGHAYIQLAESFRDDSGRPRQRVVSTLGRADETGGQVDAILNVIWSPKNGHHKVYYFLTLWRLYEEVNTGSAVHG